MRKDIHINTKGIMLLIMISLFCMILSSCQKKNSNIVNMEKPSETINSQEASSVTLGKSSDNAAKPSITDAKTSSENSGTVSSEKRSEKINVDIANSNENIKSINFPATISTVFPDKNFAQVIAAKLNKDISSTVTKEELANITGELICPPGDMSDLSGVGYLTGITTLNCSKNNVTTIPAEIGNLSNLEVLDLCKAYGVSSIPSEIGKLKKLKYIRLAFTKIDNIPKEIGDLNNLRVLMLSCNNLNSVPEDIGNLSNLEYLYFDSNSLSQIPESISKLINLRKLDISNNKLISLPQNIGQLKKLKYLDISKNNLKVVPTSVSEMIELENLNTSGNPELSENYKKYLPKNHTEDKKIVNGQNCIIDISSITNNNNIKITYDLKTEDENSGGYLDLFPLNYDYSNIKPQILADNKIQLSNDLLNKTTAYVLRAVVKHDATEVPTYDVYKWHISNRK